MSIKTIGVVGAGTMGSGIAQAAAVSGYQVVMQDIAAWLGTSEQPKLYLYASPGLIITPEVADFIPQVMNNVQTRSQWRRDMIGNRQRNGLPQDARAL